MRANLPSVSLMPAPVVDVDVDSRPAPLEPRACGKEQPSLRWHLRALRRHRRLALAVLGLVIAGAAIFTLAVTPVYEARVKLLIEPDTPNVVAFKEVIEQNTANLDYYETQLGILRSRSLARKTMDALGLWNVPELSGGQRRTLRARLSGWLPFVLQPARSADETTAQSRAIDAFLSRLTLTYRADNRLVDVKVRSVDARRAADIANTLARVFTDDAIAARLQASRDASKWLQAKLAEQGARVQASETALQQYREQHPDLSLTDQQNVATQKLADLSAAVTRAKTERIEADSLYAQLRAIQQDPDGFDAFPLILSNPYVQQLKAELAALQRDEVTKSQRLGERHPEMVRARSAIERTRTQLDAEVGKITESARQQALALESQERSLAAAVESQKQQTLSLGRIAIESAALERDAMGNRQLFEGLLQRAKEAELSSQLKTTNVRVVDAAELPSVPVFPRRGLILLLALLGGVPLALGSAFAWEHLDDRIKSPDDITGHLGIRFLGFSPIVPKRVMTAGVPFVNGDTAPEYAEALRGVRANLLLSAPAHGAKSLLVTSSGPGEGKTLVASTLAASLARSGRDVLLIDADMRRAQVHKVFGVDLEPGLTAVLQGTTSLSGALQRTAIPGLTVLTAGVSLDAPADLLQRTTFGTAIECARQQFDWIVFDSPPVLVAPEVLGLAQAASAVVFVVGAHMVNPREARAALEQLAPSGAKIVGAVLSRSDEERQSPYSYARYREYYRH